MSAAPISILHVDDDEGQRQNLAYLLRAEGFAVQMAATGAEALRLAADTPDVMILDVGLPDFSGFEVCRRVKADAATASIRILELSGHFTSSVDRVHGLEGGADAYLTKPADPLEIIAQVRALARVRHAEDKFRALFESAPDAMVIINQGGEMVRVNEQAVELFGYNRRELIGETVEMLVPERFRQGHPELRRAYFAAPQPRMRPMGNASKALAARRKDGSEFPVEISLSPLKTEDGMLVTAAIRDLSQRRKGEDAIRRLAAIVESSDDAIVLKTLDGTITSWNAGAVRLYGQSADEVLGRPISILWPPEGADEILGSLDRIRDGERVEPFEMVRVQKDGKKIHVSLSMFAITDARGDIVGVCSIARDITQRKTLEEQFRQSQKMDAIGRLAGGIAHDFNNLLTVINGYSEVLLTQTCPGDPMRGGLELIRKSGERAAGLTRQLLAFSRKQVLVPAVLDLNSILGDMEKMLRRLIGEDIDLRTSLDPLMWRIKADPGQLEQVVMNLVVNARDAMPQGGKLTLETRNVELDESYVALHPSALPGRYAMLAVSDTGHGMDKATQARIFEPFFTTKAPDKGTGLGLSTVYGIVKQSHGHIEVYSEPNQGTTFKIYFPQSNSIGPLRKSRQGTAKPTAGSETILVVEDDAEVRSLTRLVLESRGYTVLEAANGGEALLRCEQHAGPIHMLLTDVVMPAMSGPQLAERLAPLRPGVKQLFLSGYTGEAVMHHGILSADKHFLQKPYKPDDLARKVRETLDQ